jgi:hypothetical protein
VYACPRAVGFASALRYDTLHSMSILIFHSRRSPICGSGGYRGFPHKSVFHPPNIASKPHPPAFPSHRIRRPLHLKPHSFHAVYAPVRPYSIYCLCSALVHLAAVANSSLFHSISFPPDFLSVLTRNTLGILICRHRCHLQHSPCVIRPLVSDHV